MTNQYLPAGYRPKHVNDIEAAGQTDSIRELLEKARALTVLAHYARDPHEGCLVAKANKKLRAGKEDGAGLFSAFLTGRLDHASAHAHTLCIIASHPGGPPYTSMAPHQRAIMENALSVCWVLDSKVDDAERFIRLAQLLIDDLDSIKGDPQLPADFDLDDVKKKLVQRYVARSTVGIRNDKARAVARERAKKPLPGRADRARSLFDEDVVAAWYRLSSDSHYSQAWDQILLYRGSGVRVAGADINVDVPGVNPRQDAIRNYAATLTALDLLLSETKRVLEFSKH